LAHKKTLGEAISEAFELEEADAAAGMSLRIWQAMLRNFREELVPHNGSNEGMPAG
jgi:hypothetical protein